MKRFLNPLLKKLCGPGVPAWDIFHEYLLWLAWELRSVPDCDGNPYEGVQ